MSSTRTPRSPMWKRRTATVEEGIVHEVPLEPGVGSLVVYEPGTGRKYILMLIPLREQDEVCEVLSAPPSATLVIDCGTGRSGLIGASGLLGVAAFQDEMGIYSAQDAIVLCELVGHLLRRPTDVSVWVERLEQTSKILG